jgi:hypothetical protein
MSSDFQPPPKNLSILASVGGVVTAVIAIAGFNYWSSCLSQNTQTSASPTENVETQAQKVAKLDANSVVIPGTPVTTSELAKTKTPYLAPGVGKLDSADMAAARLAWSYFQHNWNDKTGLVNSVDGFNSVTMWDQAAAIAALVSAKELNLIPAAEFEAKMSKMLQTLASLPLYKGELPNKVYNVKTLIPVNYGQLDQREEIGWSAIDLGRIALWLKIVEAKYPKMRSPVQAV